MKRRKLTKRQLELQVAFDAMMQRHSKPLERGAKAKGLQVIVNETWSPSLPSSTRGPAQSIPSRVTPGGSARKAKQNVYTGTAILGVATMHKSSAVPVFSPQEADEIAHMRR